MRRVTFTGKIWNSFGSGTEGVKAEVGMEVAGIGGSDWFYVYGKITKITPTGQILVEYEVEKPNRKKGKCEKRFTKEGFELSRDGLVRSRLCHAGDARAFSASRKIISAVSRQLSSLSIESSESMVLSDLVASINELEKKILNAKAELVMDWNTTAGVPEYMDTVIGVDDDNKLFLSKPNE